MLTVWNVDHEDEEHDCMEPPGEPLDNMPGRCRTKAGKGNCQHSGDGHEPFASHTEKAVRDIEGEIGDHQEKDQRQYEERVEGPLDVRRLEEETPDDCDDYDEQHEERGEVGDEGDDGVQDRSEKVQAEPRKDTRYDEFSIHKELQENESPEEEEMIHAKRLLHHFLLPETEE